MTAAKKSKIIEFELDEKFREKYPEFGCIYATGKNLVLEHFKGGLMLSKYHSDDLIKTIEDLQETFLKDNTIDIEFSDNSAKDFLKDFGQILARSIHQGAQQEESQVKEEQQQKSSVREEIDKLKGLYQNITSEEWTTKLKAKYQNLRDVVKVEMPEIWEGLEFELSVSRTLNIYGCTLPFVGIILGRPSSYKTVILELLEKWHNTFFTDDFTARSFVSHSTSVESEEELERIDMLPRMKNNLFLTPELAPMFTTKEEDLTKTLGIITRIADGHGYKSESGAHGHRGYGPTMFVWVGAAVEIPWRVYKILNNLGHRLYFYRLYFADESQDELTVYAAQKEHFDAKKAKIQEALFDYLKWLETNPCLIDDPNDTTNKKVEWDYSKDSGEALKIIAGMGDVLSYLRCIAQVYMTEDSQGSDYSYTISPREVPRRAIRALSNLARGHAILDGRNYITMDDISIVVKTATDSAMVERVSLFGLLMACRGSLTTTQILQSLRVARKTALRTMAELHTIGLATMEDYHEDGQHNISKRLVLNPRFDWMLENPVITKIFPHTIPFFSEDEEKEDIGIIFWAIYDRLENNGNGDARIVNHKKLHETLVSSGKFYAGDATQIISDMVKAGKLEPVSFHSYRKKE